MEDRIDFIIDLYNVEKYDAIEYTLSYYFHDIDVLKMFEKIKNLKCKDYGHYVYLISKIQGSDHIKDVFLNIKIYEYLFF